MDDALLKIQQDLLFTNWSVLQQLDANDSYDLLLNEVMRSLDKFALKRLIRLRACDKFQEPWSTVRLKKYNLKCRKLCNKACTTG